MGPKLSEKQVRDYAGDLMLRVYVEANFVLDVAYERDRNSQQLLELARNGRVQLAIPHTALWESNSAITNDTARFKKFANECRKMSNDLDKLEAAKEAVSALRDAATRLRSSQTWPKAEWVKRTAA